MILHLEGKQYDVPANEIQESKSAGMVRTTGGIITERDIDRADNAATETAINEFSVELQRVRLYVELADGTIMKESPIGVSSGHVWCHWMIRFVSRSVLETYQIDTLPNY